MQNNVHVVLANKFLCHRCMEAWDDLTLPSVYFAL